MKAVRVLGLVLGGLAVLLLVAGGIAFNSSFQTWAARRALAAQTDWHGTIGSLSAGLDRVEVRDLRIETRGAVLTLPSLEVELPLISAGLGNRLIVGRLLAHGWTLDLTGAKQLAAWLAPALRRDGANAAPAPEFSLVSSAQAAEVAAPAPAGFRGILAALKLPVDVALDGLDLDGELVMARPGGGEPVRLRIKLSGGGMAAGHDGTFALEASEAKNDGGALTLQGTIVATMDSPRTFRRLGIKANAVASAAQFPTGVKLAIDATTERTPDGETYGFSAAGANKQLASVQADFSAASSRLAGHWTLDVSQADIAPFALGRALPTFAATGEGTLETGGAWEEVHAVGRLNATASHLVAWRPELSAVGPLRLAAEFDVLWHGKALRVDRFTGSVAGATPIASMRALQPFEFDLQTAGLKVADPAQDLIWLTLDSVPLAWVQPLLGDCRLTGGDLRGEFAGSARGGGLELRAKTPLTVAGLTLAISGEPLVRGIDLSLDIAADYTPDGWQAQVTKLVASQRGKEILALQGRAGQLAGKDQPVKLAGHWHADLAAVSAQPAVAGVIQLGSGVVDGQFEASLAGSKVGEAKMALANLVAATGERLPAVKLECGVNIGADGRIGFKAPLAIESGGRKSDLAVSGTLGLGNPVKIDAHLVGSQVYVDDLQAFALLLPAGGPPDGAAPAAKKPAGPIWAGINGRFTLAVGKAVLHDALSVANLKGTVELDPTVLKLSALQADLGSDSDVKLTGGVTFAAKAKAPYTLNADVAVDNFDTAPAFRALDPAKPPTVETRLDVTGHVTGTGATPGGAAERLQGELQVTGKGGIFRGLPVDLANKLPKRQSTVAMLGGLLGAVTGKKETADYVQDLYAFAKLLSEIPFDQLSVKAVRDASLNVQLQNFSLIAPELRLTGSGSIRHVEGQPLLAQPLSLAINVGARGNSGDLMKRLKLLDTSKQDSLGYASLVLPVTIGGTLEKPNANEFGAAVVKYVFERTGLLDSILGR